MRFLRIILIGLFLVLLALGLVWLSQWPRSAGSSATAQTPPQKRVVRLGLIPERDIYAQRRAFRSLEAYLETKTGAEFELVTCSSYQGVLKDFQENQVDAAFLGSLVAVLVVDRVGGEVLLKPEYEGGISTYCGVVFVREESPVRSFADLGGKTVGAVRTTTGGAITPVLLMVEHGMIGMEDTPRLKWVGTHDDVIREVVLGNLDAGAVKDLRLDAWRQRHPQFKVRELARTPRVPENALVVRKDFPPDLREKIRTAMLAMQEEPQGREVLKTMSLTRFVPCQIESYHELYDMIERLGAAWPETGVDGPAPKRPASRPATEPAVKQTQVGQATMGPATVAPPIAGPASIERGVVGQAVVGPASGTKPGA